MTDAYVSSRQKVHNGNHMIYIWLFLLIWRFRKSWLAVLLAATHCSSRMSLVLTPPNSYLSGLSVGLPRLWVRVHIPRERPKHSIHPRSSKISKFTSMAQQMLDMARRQQRNEVELNQLPQVGFGEYVLRPVTIGAYSWRRNVTYASCHYCKKAVKEVSGGY